MTDNRKQLPHFEKIKNAYFKKITIRSALIVGTLISFTGCSSTAVYEPKPNVTPLKEGTIITNTASLRHTYIHNPKTQMIICAEPAPDTGFAQDDSTDGLSISLLHTGDQNSLGGESEGSSEDELTGRTPSLLIARELLFRACEFAANFKLNTENALSVYMRNLDIIEKVAAIESERTTIEIKDSISNTTNQNIALKNTKLSKVKKEVMKEKEEKENQENKEDDRY